MGEIWTNEEKRRLKAMHLDPVRSPPLRLRELINYFRIPESSLWAVTEGHGPFQVSKSLGTKIRDLVADGALNWVIDETAGQPTAQMDPEWRSWLLSHAPAFSTAVSVYIEEMSFQIQLTEVHFELRSSVMSPKVAYGPSYRPFIESVFSRDPELKEIRIELKKALDVGEIAEAKRLSEMVGAALVQRIAI